jgi:hypothetical protein
MVVSGMSYLPFLWGEQRLQPLPRGVGQVSSFIALSNIPSETQFANTP